MTLMNYLARDILRENILPKLMYELALINEPSIMPSPYTKGAQGPMMMMIMTTSNILEWKKIVMFIFLADSPYRTPITNAILQLQVADLLLLFFSPEQNEIVIVMMLISTSYRRTDSCT